MTTILLTRHGQTEWNREERYRGRADIPLNATGERQAAALAERLSAFPVTALYTSPLQRAVRTGEICAARLGLRSAVLPGLLDIDFGAWQGLAPEAAAARDPEVYRQWLVAPGTIRFPGGEGLEDVQRRAMEALETVIARHPEETVVLVAHMVVNRVLLCTVLGLDLNHYFDLRQDTCSLNIFRCLGSQRYEIVTLNDTCHMASAG
ncbi:MAG: histidine phosphatase family protein [Anaerolineae bacterium]|nr:histidine phosphatase family protein [Anaerolineae bacterium]